jgi:hypothetical protein
MYIYIYIILFMIQCRICLEENNQDDMISPCLCRGTSKYVHRECLNKWIESKVNQEASIKCQECHFQYYKIGKKIKCEYFFKTLGKSKTFFFITNQIITFIGYTILNQIYYFNYSIWGVFFYINNYFLMGICLNLFEFLIFMTLFYNMIKSKYQFSREKIISIQCLLLSSLILLPLLPLISISFNFILLGDLFSYYYEYLLEINNSGYAIESIDDATIKLIRNNFDTECKINQYV